MEILRAPGEAEGWDQHMADRITLNRGPLLPDVRRKKKGWVLMQIQWQVW